ncbi:MAG: hypothetical protein RLO81_16015 [Fulvivirga sp.]|uniref:hypothetical protein n=1 Tax=Fulvivirga sp. TaxID=1931237 RepID=UPI0032EFD07C
MGTLKNRIFSFSLLSTYLGAFLVYFVCNLGDVAGFDRNYTQEEKSHSEGHHSHAHDHDAHSHDHSESESGTEECCDDFTSKLVYDAKILVKELQVSFSNFQLNQVQHFIAQFTNSYKELTTLLYEIDRPPPRQASILILFQVFRI